MLVARGQLENRQAIVRIGFQPFIPEALDVRPSSATYSVPVTEYRALIDTGAQRTCLCRGTIAKESLVSHGKKPIQNVYEVARHYLFWANLGVFCERVSGLNDPESERTYYALEHPIEVIDIADSYWFDAILGMDVMSKMDLRIERSGAFSLSLP